MSVTSAIQLGVAIFGAVQQQQSAKSARKAARRGRPKVLDPKATTVDVAGGEGARQAVFRRLARLRRATLVSGGGLEEPPGLSTRLGGGGSQ